MRPARDRGSLNSRELGFAEPGLFMLPGQRKFASELSDKDDSTSIHAFGPETIRTARRQHPPVQARPARAASVSWVRGVAAVTAGQVGAVSRVILSSGYPPTESSTRCAD